MNSRKTTLPLDRLYRAHVEPHHRRGVERTAYVEAFSEHGAVELIAAAIAAIERRPSEEVRERIYNCASARELIDQGESTDYELRLFEVGWSAERIHFVRHPLFLVESSGPLARAWARTLFLSPREDETPLLTGADLGIAWWNSLTPADRGAWLARAHSTVPADAWAAYQRATAASAIEATTQERTA